MFEKTYRKLKASLVNYHGFLSEEGKLFCYRRFHSIGLGALDGIGYHRKGYRLEFWINNHADVAYKPHYYDLGYFLGSKPKWAFFGALVYVYGPQILVML